MALINPVQFCQDYYKLNGDLDEILYPGYHIPLLEEACETNTTRIRGELMEAAEFHQEYSSTITRQLNANAYKISEATREDDQQLLQTVIFIDILQNMFLI